MALVLSVTRDALVYTVTLEARGDQVLDRWATDAGRNRANQLQEILERQLRQKRQDYRAADAPTMWDRYAALAPADRATVEALLNAVVIPPE